MGTPPSSLRRLGSAGAGFVVGLILLAVGLGIGLGHLLKGGVTPVALLGLAALVCGGALALTAGVAIARATPSWWRLLSVPALLLAAVFVVYVLAVPLRVAVPGRAEPPAAAPGELVGARAVTVDTVDDERLAGWYSPSTSGAAVVLVPGSGSSSAALGRHATVLAEAGFGVLALDPRGQGDSSGRGNDWGWFGEEDVPATVTWLTEQEDVDPARIAVVGLSMGGEEAIGAAGADHRIRAVVAEGAMKRTAADMEWLVDAYGWRGSVTLGIQRVQTAVADLLSPASPPPPLREAASAAAPRPILLITAGERPDEGLAAESIRAASPDSVEVWEVPGATHTAGLRTDPSGWTERVIGFLTEATR
ncbi:alpha/beta hydrolase [Nostocoides sp. F2B08]|uniref:alpha/beta hydrolase n=1 Tax=Nostocoides sp. F2B08 TaxID=2653936 RepID=UPI00186B5080|nr:alpha/beta fold hydrolase [Tetrasphaera sp. F2B08]